MNTEHRIRGAVLGLAWGDVLGCPVEGWRESQIQEVYGDYCELPEAYDYDAIEAAGAKLTRLRPLGLHSDDTQQALALLNICMDGWSCEAWAACLVDGLDKQAWRGYGRNFAKAVHALRKGMPPEMAGSSSAGMGAAMRVGPVGACYHDAPEMLAKVAWESTLVTHGDIRAGALSHAVAWTVGRLVAGETPTDVANTLASAVAETENDWQNGHPDWTIDRQAGQLVSNALAAVLPQRDLPLPQLQELISETARPHLAKGFSRAHPNQGFVLLGGLHAITMSLRSADAPNELLLAIVRQGFDTDTVAAIAGAILGARFGDSWIPDECFHDRTSLNAYADALAGRHATEKLPMLMSREARFTQFEKEFQQDLSV